MCCTSAADDPRSHSKVRIATSRERSRAVASVIAASMRSTIDPRGVRSRASVASSTPRGAACARSANATNERSVARRRARVFHARPFACCSSSHAFASVCRSAIPVWIVSRIDPHARKAFRKRHENDPNNTRSCVRDAIVGAETPVFQDVQRAGARAALPPGGVQRGWPAFGGSCLMGAKRII